MHKGGFERVTDYPKAIEDCLAELKQAGAIASENELSAVGFKTVIAKDVTGCVRLDERVLQAMTDYNGLAPAHNPPYITGIKLFAQRVPHVPLIALFETAFHQFAPEASQRYAVPETWHKSACAAGDFTAPATSLLRNGRRNCCAGRTWPSGPGIFTSIRAPRLIVGAPLRVISCHLGGSSSITGILNGASIGTSMGLSPQSGLPQNNRVGDLDAEALPYAVKTLGLSLEEAQRQLSKQSGLLGLSGVSNDMRDIAGAAAQGNANARLALDVFVASARHWIGSYYLQLNGADAIVFTAGAGENQARSPGRDLRQPGQSGPQAGCGQKQFRARQRGGDQRRRLGGEDFCDPHQRGTRGGAGSETIFRNQNILTHQINYASSHWND